MLSSMTINASRRLANPMALRVASKRALTGSTSKIDIDHYEGKWSVYGDIDGYTPEKFQIKTYNKISPKVNFLIIAVTHCFVYCIRYHHQASWLFTNLWVPISSCAHPSYPMDPLILTYSIPILCIIGP